MFDFFILPVVNPDGWVKSYILKHKSLNPVDYVGMNTLTLLTGFGGRTGLLIKKCLVCAEGWTSTETLDTNGQIRYKSSSTFLWSSSNHNFSWTFLIPDLPHPSLVWTVIMALLHFLNQRLKLLENLWWAKGTEYRATLPSTALGIRFCILGDTPARKQETGRTFVTLRQ